MRNWSRFRPGLAGTPPRLTMDGWAWCLAKDRILSVSARIFSRAAWGQAHHRGPPDQSWAFQNFWVEASWGNQDDFGSKEQAATTDGSSVTMGRLFFYRPGNSGTTEKGSKKKSSQVVFRHLAKDWFRQVLSWIRISALSWLKERSCWRRAIVPAVFL